ncbi:MAG: YicC family protein [Hyphomicrobiales bacterium]|nr:YicC family protein [Hyphomicrobiales bacterium]MCP5373854.1 YicC family protein [Hyphomicrobiales bacterium]
MTGFARVQGSHGVHTWTWEVKSVNGKGLDLRFRMPAGFDAIDKPAREAVAARFARGNLFVALTVSHSQALSRFRLNEGVLDQIVAVIPQIRARMPEVGAPTLDGLLSLRGVLEVEDEDQDEEARAAFNAALLASLEEGLEALADNRAAEGARLEPVIAGHLARIEELRGAAAAVAATQPQAIHDRLVAATRDLAEAVPALSEERLAQEVAVLAAKADVREELDRLAAHVEAGNDLLAGGGAVGRKLDFLCQEFNREANTLCSKSSDIELTRIGLDLKSVIDQLREQVQNVE